MKKTLIGTLLIIPVLWAGMTWVASNKTEEVFNNMLAQSQQRITEAAPILTIEKQSFSKGFISSTAKSIIHIAPEIFDSEDPFKITLNHSIYHGPLMLTADGIKIGTSYIITTLDQSPLEEKTRQAITLIFAGNQPLTSKTHTQFDSSITESFDIPALVIDSVALESIFEHKQNNTNNFKLSLAGISGKFTTNPEASYLNGFISAGTLNITGKDSQDNFDLAVKPSNVKLDIDELYHGAMLLGSVSLKLPEVLLSDGKQSISLKDMLIKSSGDEFAESYNQTATIDIDKLLMNADSSPSIFPESKLHMSFALKGLDQTATKRLIDHSQSINQAQISLLNSQNSSQAQQQFDTDISNYLQALSNLIKPGLTNNNIIELSNNKGASSIHFDLSYVSAQKLFELKTLKELIIALSAEFRLNIDKKMVAGTAVEQLLNSPMTNNAIKSNADAYTTIAILDNGQLNLNGEPVPLFDMLGPAAEEPLEWEKHLQ